MSGGSGDEAQRDADLVRAARDGDARAFERLLERHEATVLRVLRLMGVPAQERDDLAQDVFVRAFRYLDGFRPGAPFGGWIYRISVNVAHDFGARVRRRRKDEAGWTVEADRAADAAPDPEERGVGADLRRRLERALAVLTDRERAVFVLREIEGLSTEEVAGSLGISRITVRRHLGRARDRLQRVLETDLRRKKSDRD